MFTGIGVVALLEGRGDGYTMGSLLLDDWELPMAGLMEFQDL